MANIDTYLENIMQARYGRDVRQSIHDGIEAINEDAESAVDIATQAKGEAKTAQDSAQAYANQALAHEQQAQIYRNQAEQFKDEAFSGTPEGYEDVVNKVNSLKEHTVTYLAEVGTHEGSVLAKRIYGMSVQDGTPTPDSPVEIESAKADFRCAGKNLIPYPYYATNTTLNGITYTINEDGSITAQGTATGNAYLRLSENLKIKQGIYKGTLNATGESTNTYTLRYYNDDEGWSHVFNNNGNVTIPSDRVGRLALRVSTGQTVDLIFKPQLILATNSDLSYELNQHIDVTTNLTLRSIEVASTDDYTYERDGKYYIADTIDWSEDRGYEITRRVGEVVYDGSEDETWTRTMNNNKNVHVFYITPENTLRTNNNNALCLAYSNRFYRETRNEFNNTSTALGTFIQRTGMEENYGYFVFAPLSDMSSSTEWREWLASNNVTLDYVLATPTTEPITSEQAQALLSLKTYDEATSITATSDIEPTIDLEYATSEMSAKALTGHNEGYIAQELESVYGVKNLIPYPYADGASKTLNGITFTVNEDGSITVNGTSTVRNANYNCLYQVSKDFFKDGDYILSCEGIQNASADVTLIFNNLNGTTWLRNIAVVNCNNTEVRFHHNTSLTDYDKFSIVLQIVSVGTTVNNLTFKPMLRPASIQSNEYQPYAMSNYELTKLVKELQTAIIELGGN